MTVWNAEPQLRREQAAITARKALPWWRRGILLRRPWRAPTTMWDAMRPPKRGAPLSWACRLAVATHNGWQWLRFAHDCSDPAMMCSCSGSFRFPRVEETP